MGQQDALAATTREIAAGPLPYPRVTGAGLAPGDTQSFPVIRPIIERVSDAQSDLPVYGESVAVTGVDLSVVLRALWRELAEWASQVDGLMTMGPVALASG